VALHYQDDRSSDGVVQLQRRLEQGELAAVPASALGAEYAALDTAELAVRIVLADVARFSDLTLERLQDPFVARYWMVLQADLQLLLERLR